MSSFDKFMKDLEERQRRKIADQERQKRSDSEHNLRGRVRLYAEKWQNSIRFSKRTPK